MINKAIILAGGAGTRLHPLTSVLSKQMLGVYDKPMIYYPLSLMLQAGITDFAIVCTPEHKDLYVKTLSSLHINATFTFILQYAPKGIAEAFILCREFISNDAVALILGDNLFHGSGLNLTAGRQLKSGAQIYGKRVHNPQDYGVAIVKNHKVVKIVEKPAVFLSDLAIPGLYFYDKTVVSRALKLKPSARGELEITDLNNSYIEDKALHLDVLDDSVAWFDTGSFDSLFEASMYIKTVQSRTGCQIGLPEEAALKSGSIKKRALLKRLQTAKRTPHVSYLINKYSKL